MSGLECYLSMCVFVVKNSIRIVDSYNSVLNLLFLFMQAPVNYLYQKNCNPIILGLQFLLCLLW